MCYSLSYSPNNMSRMSRYIHANASVLSSPDTTSSLTHLGDTAKGNHHLRVAAPVSEEPLQSGKRFKVYSRWKKRREGEGKHLEKNCKFTISGFENERSPVYLPINIYKLLADSQFKHFELGTAFTSFWLLKSVFQCLLINAATLQQSVTQSQGAPIKLGIKFQCHARPSRAKTSIIRPPYPSAWLTSAILVQRWGDPKAPEINLHLLTSNIIQPPELSREFFLRDALARLISFALLRARSLGILGLGCLSKQILLKILGYPWNCQVVHRSTEPTSPCRKTSKECNYQTFRNSYVENTWIK